MAACGEVEHCTRGSVGCLDGPPNGAGQCRFGLVPRGNLCVEPENAGDGQAPIDQPKPCGDCKAGTTCATDQKKCLDFCAEPDVLPGSGTAPEPIRCGGELKDSSGARYELTFDETCIADCQLTCRLREWFCTTGCAEDACAQPEVLSACHARCDDASSPLACMQSICSDTRSKSCVTTGDLCGNGEPPDCAKAACTNTCATTPYDGVCDDGDLLSASFASCEWGSDCADCGPRVGEDVSRGLLQGAACSLSEQCKGYSGDLTVNEAFCLPVNSKADVKHCLLDCSGRTELCPAGTTCSTLNTEVDGKQVPVTDSHGLEARACLPDACR